MSDAISSTSLCLLCMVYEILPCSGRQFQVYGTWLCHKCSSAVVVNVTFVYFKHVGRCWHFIVATDDMGAKLCNQLLLIVCDTDCRNSWCIWLSNGNGKTIVGATVVAVAVEYLTVVVSIDLAVLWQL
uniref:Uncharacterized protein n=1 Tax=Glossina austeni TaxID=7395 RepID=A0A1A9VXF2_GLOAU